MTSTAPKVGCMEAGTGFEPVMLRAYETAVVTTLPAIIYSAGVSAACCCCATCASMFLSTT